jgi:phosphinothricin acetyltransferase
MVRLARPDDASEVQRLYAPVVSETAISFEVEVPTVGEMRARLIKTLKTYPWFVAEGDGHVIGYAYASQHRARQAYRWSVDVGVYVDPAAQRRGVASELYRALFETLHAQGFTAAFAGIVLPNEASIALHRQLGFEFVGTYRNVGYKAGAWRDVSWWQLELAERRLPPPVPQPLDISSLKRASWWPALRHQQGAGDERL